MHPETSCNKHQERAGHAPALPTERKAPRWCSLRRLDAAESLQNEPRNERIPRRPSATYDAGTGVAAGSGTRRVTMTHAIDTVFIDAILKCLLRKLRLPETV